MEGSEQHGVGLKISWIQDFGVWIVYFSGLGCYILRFKVQ